MQLARIEPEAVSLRTTIQHRPFPFPVHLGEVPVVAWTTASACRTGHSSEFRLEVERDLSGLEQLTQFLRVKPGAIVWEILDFGLL